MRNETRQMTKFELVIYEVIIPLKIVYPETKEAVNEEPTILSFILSFLFDVSLMIKGNWNCVHAGALVS